MTEPRLLAGFVIQCNTFITIGLKRLSQLNFILHTTFLPGISEHLTLLLLPKDGDDTD